MTPYQTALRDGLLAAERGDQHKQEIEETIATFRAEVEALTRGVVFVRRYDSSGCLIATVGKGPMNGATLQLCSKVEPDPAGYPVTVTGDLLSPSGADGSRATSPAVYLADREALAGALASLLSHPKTGAWMRDALRAHDGLMAHILDGAAPLPEQAPEVRPSLAPASKIIKTKDGAAS